MWLVILHNVNTGRFHPAMFTLAPFPGPGPDPVTRLRSRAHHTEGFATLEEAQANVRDDLAPRVGSMAVIDDTVEPWDGEIGVTLLREAPAHV